MEQNQNMAHQSTGDSSGYWICPGYAFEICVFSDGSVVPCCQDPLGSNVLGNCNDTPMLELWNTKLREWHASNVRASQEGRPWDSKQCFESCFEHNRLKHFGIKNDATRAEFEEFRKELPEYPLAIVIEPIAACNYSCHFCFSGRGNLPRIKKTLSAQVLREQIAPFLGNLQKVRLYNYGEPFLHPEIKDIIRIIREYAPKIELEISTNAVLMTADIAEVLVECQVNRLIVSLHGGHTQEYLARFATNLLDGDYEAVQKKVKSMRHGPNISLIERNIRNLIGIKHRMGKQLPWISVKALLGNWNETSSYMDDYLLWARRLGVDFAGFGMAFTNGFSSTRFKLGTPLWDCVAQRKLYEYDFNPLFPTWPSDDFVPPVPVGGLFPTKKNCEVWYEDVDAP